MKETYFCTKTKKIQKKSQKCTENHGNEKSKCDLYGLRYRLCQGGFFCSGYRSLIGKVLRFFSLKFRSLGRFVAESILNGHYAASRTHMLYRKSWSAGFDARTKSLTLCIADALVADDG